jgi:multicomponent Na+:H+ antiporter subunit F
MADPILAGTILWLAGALILLSVVFSLMRLAIGETAVDRVIAIDVLTITTMALIVLTAHTAERFIYVDVAIVYALLSFLGVLAVARYLEHGL